MKIKMNRFLFGITLMLLLTVSSCKGFVQGFKSEESPKSPVITLSLDKGNARTAFPQMDTSIITKFILKGALDNGAQETLGEWSTDNATSAYDKMTADELPIAAGSWVFTLTALCEDEGLVLVSYTGSLDKEIEPGQNSLSFTLDLNEVNVSQEAGAGELEISIKLSSDLEDTVRKITGTLYASDRTEYDPEKQVAVSSGSAHLEVGDDGNYTYSVDDIDAGTYYAEIKFYSDTEGKSLLGTYPEVVNINSLGAVSSISIPGLDKAYEINYFKKVLDSSGSPTYISEGSNTNQKEYTRLVEVNLQDIEWIGDGSNTFWKWVALPASQDEEIDYFTASTVSKIEKKTVGDKYFCAVFVKDKELEQITDVEISGTNQVGEKLTATPKVEGEDFTGTVIDWKWYYGDEDSWTQIDESEVSVVESSDSENPSSSIFVKPEYVEKNIKAEAIQKYKPTKENGKIKALTKNTKDTPGAAKSGATASVVAKGTLNKGDISLKYEVDSDRGAPLDGSKIKIKDGKVKDSVHTGWTYTPTFIYTGDVTAPSSSGNVSVPVRFSVPGYNDLTTNLNVFVNVKYPQPSAETAKALLSTERAAITFGKYKFTTTAVTNGTWEYSLDGDSYSALDENEHSYSETTEGKLYIRNKQVGEKDSAGYVGASAPREITLVNPDDLGTKVVLGSVSISGDQKVGSTLTATAAPDITGQNIVIGDGKGKITWIWKDSEGSTLKTQENTHNTTSTYAIESSSLVNKKITVTASYTYEADGSNTVISKDKETDSIAKGTLTGGPTYTYSGVAVIGRALQASNVVSSGEKYVNENGTEIAPSSSHYSFDPANTPEENGNVKLIIKIPGYNDMTQEHLAVKVKHPAPAVSTLVSTEKTKVPLGKIKFTKGEGSPDLDKLEFRYSADDAAEASSWHAIPENPILNKGDVAFADGNLLYVRYKATQTIEASDESELEITTDVIGTRQLREISIINVVGDPSVTLTASGSTVTAGGSLKSGATFAWYVDGELVEGAASSSLELDSSVAPVSGVYSVTVRTQNTLGDDVSVTATVNVTVQ